MLIRAMPFPLRSRSTAGAAIGPVLRCPRAGFSRRRLGPTRQGLRPAGTRKDSRRRALVTGSLIAGDSDHAVVLEPDEVVPAERQPLLVDLRVVLAEERGRPDLG